MSGLTIPTSGLKVQKIPPGVESPANLDEILRDSDIISLHVPSLPDTRHMIGQAQLAMVKDGALFINTAR